MNPNKEPMTINEIIELYKYCTDMAKSLQKEVQFTHPERV